MNAGGLARNARAMRPRSFIEAQATPDLGTAVQRPSGEPVETAWLRCDSVTKRQSP